MSATPEDEKTFFDFLTTLGKERVRASLDNGVISPALVSLAWDWLSKQEAEEKTRQDSVISEQMEIARRASEAADRAATAAERQAVAAERANTRATIALTIAIISIIVTVIVNAIGIWVTSWTAHK